MRFPAAALVSLLVACASAPPSRAPAARLDAAASAREVRRLADEYVAGYRETEPISYFLRGFALEHHDSLPDNRPAALAAWQRREDDWARSLAAVDAGGLWGRPEWVLRGMLAFTLESSRRLRVCRYELWSVAQVGGWQNAMARAAESQPVDTEAQRRDALTRWSRLPTYIDAEIGNLREGLRLGYTAPQHIVDLVVAQMDAMVKAPADQSPFYRPAARAHDERLSRELATLINDRIDPALARYRDFLRDEYRPRAREPLSLGAQRDGDACYRASLFAYTSLDLSPAELRARGQAAVDAAARRRDQVAREVIGATTPEAIAAYKASPVNRVASAEEALAIAQDVLARARAALPRWFGRAPTAEIVIAPYPEFMRTTDPIASYERAAVDGSRPATYRMNLFHPATKQRGALEWEAAHETLPGHHIQISLGQASVVHPLMGLVGTSGFSEGWARYAEKLADEMGVLSSAGRVEVFSGLPMGMLVDTGVHSLGWTRDQARTFTCALEGCPHGLDDANAYVDRIAIKPGQMTTYGTGEMVFTAARARAQETLGDRFSLPDFHDEVLRHGTLTLGMLDEVVDRWIAAQLAKP